MESLISDIRVWYSRNMLKSNDSKTVMLVIRNKFRQNFHFKDISIGESIISLSPTIRNLGVIMDPAYTMSSRVSHLVRVAFLKLRELSYLRRYLADESTKTAVHAYITSRLHYCNSLLFGLPQEPTMKMQNVMNAAIRIVTKSRNLIISLLFCVTYIGCLCLTGVNSKFYRLLLAKITILASMLVGHVCMFVCLFVRNFHKISRTTQSIITKLGHRQALVHDSCKFVGQECR